MSLAKKIVLLRKEREISQQQLADELNVKRYSIADWEQGRSEPSIINLIHLSSFFGVSVDYLVNNEINFRCNKKYITILNILERKQNLTN